MPVKTVYKHYGAETIHYYFYHTVCNSTAFLDGISVNRTIKALVRTIKRILYLIGKYLFSIKTLFFVKFIRFVKDFWPLEKFHEETNRTKLYFQWAKKMVKENSLGAKADYF